jgi:hypothetical protein
VAKVGPGVDLRVRVQPGCDVVSGRMKERSECKFSLASFHVGHAAFTIVGEASLWLD